MKKVILAVMLMMLGMMVTNAQTKSNNEYYLGYQFVRTNVQTQAPKFKFDRKTDSNGFNVSATRYFNDVSNVGLTAELGANFDGSGHNLYTTMAGVTLKANRSKRVQPFVRGLAGVYVMTKQGFSYYNNNTNFSYSLGGGVDIKFKKVTLRPLQVDYLATRNYNQFDNNVRIGGGIVW